MQLARSVRGAKPVAGSRVPSVPQSRPVAARVAAQEAVTVTSNGAAPEPTNMMDLEELTDIIRMVNETDIVELELKSKRFNLSVKKKEALKAEQPVQYIQAPAAAAPAPLPMAPAAPAPAAPAPAAAAKPAAKPPVAAAIPGGVEVSSPMSGTMYRSPAPGEPPFVREGDKVKKGQAVCIVEAMKLMNEIETEVSGTVVKLLVENGSPITPGQPIMLIKPE